MFDSFLQDTLIDNLEHAAKLIEQAERYEVLGDIYKLIIPMYEVARDFEVNILDVFHLEKIGFE